MKVSRVMYYIYNVCCACRLDLVANYIRLKGRSEGIYQYTVTYE